MTSEDLMKYGFLGLIVIAIILSIVFIWSQNITILKLLGTTILAIIGCCIFGYIMELD